MENWLSILDGAKLTGKSHKTIRRLYKHLEEKDEYHQFVKRQEFGNTGQTMIVCLREKLLDVYPEVIPGQLPGHSPTPDKEADIKADTGEIDRGGTEAGDSQNRELTDILLEQLKSRDKELEVKNDQIKMLNITLQNALSKIPQLKAPQQDETENQNQS